MSKEIMLFVMSPFSNKADEILYHDFSNEFNAVCIHTNETALKYVEWYLHQEGKQLDTVYVFVTEEVRLRHLDRFKALPGMEKINFKAVDLPNNGDLIGSFKAVSTMFDTLKADLGENFSETNIHVDMTGGPRHASMLMLALLQMLLYCHVKMGKILYTNFESRTIEDTKEIMEMFTLMGGAQEFVSYGSVEHIKSYFAYKSSSKDMQTLLDSMENFSEALKICVGYDEMKEKLEALANAISLYRKYLEVQKKQINTTDQELFFSKLLDTVEREYAAILPDERGKCDGIQIIRWCLNRGLIQQAITLYTEWLPKYILDEGFLQVVSQELLTECEQQRNSKGKKWMPLENFLFKDFDNEATQKALPDDIFYLSLRNCIQGSECNINNLMKTDAKKNATVAEFCKLLLEADEYIRRGGNVTTLLAIPKYSMLKAVVCSISTQGVELKKFLAKRMLKEMFLSKIILKQILVMNKEKVKQILFAPNSDTANSEGNKTIVVQDASVENTFLKRKKIFQHWFYSKQVLLHMDEKDFFILLQSYLNCVKVWRNSSNHAAATGGGRAKSEEIKKEILFTLNILSKKK